MSLIFCKASQGATQGPTVMSNQITPFKNKP